MNYVLVHGAYHGGWCWKKVAPLLQAAGHKVCTPTLTGLGERKHLGSAAIGLTTHIEDIVNVLVYEDLADVVLVGHSYAGMVVGGVADRIPERIRMTVYLDAVVPEDGKSMVEARGGQAATAASAFRKRAERAGSDWALPAYSAAYFDVTDPEDRRWADSKLTPHPFRTFTEPIRLTSRGNWAMPAAYILCTAQEDGFESIAARCRDRGWPVRTMATGHDCMITAAAELAGILLALAEKEWKVMPGGKTEEVK